MRWTDYTEKAFQIGVGEGTQIMDGICAVVTTPFAVTRFISAFSTGVNVFVAKNLIVAGRSLED